MAITIVSYNDNLKNDWDEFVKEADNNGFLFYRNFTITYRITDSNFC